MRRSETVTVPLSQAIEQFETERLASGYSASTLRSTIKSLDYLRERVGDVDVDHISPALVADFLGHRNSVGDAPSTVNKHRYHLAGFFKWARAHEYMPPASDPLGTTRAMKIMPARKLRIPAQDFPALLDAAEHPKDRIIVALGLYLFLRGSEIAALRWSDYDMKNHEMHVKIEKTSQRDIMPVSEELDEELRIWALWYQNQQSGIFRQDWFIVPATVTHTGHEPVLVPSRPHPQGYR
ncbi:site-specific integrase, partial [Streptomyces sp. NPDC013433]|uniref:tyrosine-type recombinase/integrase n=1 Tax=Streptomyces sp. NPDC013433 TaxID=3155604 RepID=UPI003456681F